MHLPRTASILRLAPALAVALAWSARGHADAPAGRYCILAGTTPADTVVIDSATGLTWAQAVAPGARPWLAAIDYCDKLQAAGKAWRLPSVKELLTLGDEALSAPAVDPTAFPDTPIGPVWTQSTRPDDPSIAWTVAGIDANFAMRTTQLLVRCVAK